MSFRQFGKCFGIVGLSLLTSVGGTTDYAHAQQNYKPAQTGKSDSVQDDRLLRRVIISYMAQQKFSGAEFTKQVTGTDAELEVFNVREGMLYFSIPVASYNEKTLDMLTLNRAKVEFAQPEGDKLRLGKYGYRNPGHYFFRFPAEHLRVSRDRQVKIDFGNASYDINMDELTGYLTNRNIFGGFLHFVEGVKQGREAIASNHGVVVAKPGEKSLERLVAGLTQHQDPIEIKAQKLLDFVTSKVKFDGTTTLYKAEILQRPNEVLMAREADCSGKVILYASLLEQWGIDYRILYLDDHITVAVEGNFPNENGLRFMIDDKPFTIAETTASGFIIGKSRVNKPMRVQNFRYFQKPGPNAKIFDAQTGKEAKFK